MPNVSSIIKQLKQERDRVAKQLSGIDAALTAFATFYRLPSRQRRINESRRSQKSVYAAAQRVKVRTKKRS
jgi:hypothetical protein